MKFLSPEVALYLYKSTIRPCTEYCCHVLAGVPSCYFELLDKLLKRICRTIGPSLAASLESLAHCRNVASLSLFYRLEQPIRELVVQSTTHFDGECLKKKVVLDGSGNDKIKPEDLPEYHVPPPYNYIEAISSLPETPTCEPAAEPDDLNF